MNGVTERFKISLNQNLWGLVIGFGALGLSEYYELERLFWFAVCISVVMAVSVTITTIAYTINYWKNKGAQ